MIIKLTARALISRYGASEVNFDREIAYRLISKGLAIPIEAPPKKEIKQIEIIREEKPKIISDDVIFPTTIIPKKV